jgi:putative endonuclease
MFYTYILQSLSVKDELYIGYTNDLKRRFKEHNQKQNFSTKKYAPWKLIYYEACLNELDAKRREKYFKVSQGRRLLRRRLKEYFYEEKIL